MNLNLALLDLSLQGFCKVLHRRDQFCLNVGILLFSFRLGTAGALHHGVAFASVVDCSTEYLPDSGGHAALLQSLLHRIGHLLGPGLIGLRGCEHDHEKREEQGYKVGVRNQPAFMVRMFRLSFFAGQINPPRWPVVRPRAPSAPPLLWQPAAVRRPRA